MGTAAATSLAWGAARGMSADANQRLIVGLIGCGGRGRGVAASLAGHGCRIAYVCDPDPGRANSARQQLTADHAVSDLREVLDDKAVDAVVVATPDHWHGPAAILACDAGKHVYVEKPCSHNIREGRLMVEAACRTDRVIQVGTQARSTTMTADAVAKLREGAIGKVLVAKAWNSQRRGNIGRAQPSDPPAGFDYDAWVGPAPMRPYQKNCHHYTWHWWYDFGTGDAGNDGVHELDIARWGLGDPDHPVMVSGHGSKVYFDDDQQFPDTQYVTFEFAGEGSAAGRLLVYEHRIWSPYRQEELENGNAFYGTEGMLILGKGSHWRLFGPRNKLIAEGTGRQDTDAHTANFVDAIRNGTRPNAHVEIGHHSAALAHLANILARTGHRQLAFDPENEQILDDPEANALVTRTYRDGHWAVPQGA
jgi:predicted dehydrogenase